MTPSVVESVVATGHAQLVASPTHPFAGLSRKWGNEVLCLAFEFPIFPALTVQTSFESIISDPEIFYRSMCILLVVETMDGTKEPSINSV